MKSNTLTIRKMTFCAIFTALIAVGAFIKIPVPPIPFTLQTMFVVLAGLMLGGNMGGISALLYMILGLIGIPIFTGGGGIGYVLKPTFGYIIGFCVGAYAIGKISYKNFRGSKTVQVEILDYIAREKLGSPQFSINSSIASALQQVNLF